MTVTGSEENAAAASPAEASRVSAADAGVSPPSVNSNTLAPLAPLAALLLIVGMVLGGLRLVARRVA